MPILNTAMKMGTRYERCDKGRDRTGRNSGGGTVRKHEIHGDTHSNNT
jgi:hypothetical protein